MIVKNPNPTFTELKPNMNQIFLRYSEPEQNWSLITKDPNQTWTPNFGFFPISSYYPNNCVTALTVKNSHCYGGDSKAETHWRWQAVRHIYAKCNGVAHPLKDAPLPICYDANFSSSRSNHMGISRGTEITGELWGLASWDGGVTGAPNNNTSHPPPHIRLHADLIVVCETY